MTPVDERLRREGLIHFASQDIVICGHLRQRCVWCGAMLIDYDLSRVAIEGGQPGDRPAAWSVGCLVLIDGPMRAMIPPDGDAESGYRLPEGFTTCHDIDPEITAGDPRPTRPPGPPNPPLHPDDRPIG